MDENRASRRSLRRRLTWVAGYLLACGLAYWASVAGNTDGSGLSFITFGLVLLPWIVGWMLWTIDPPLWLVVLTCIALNVGLIWAATGRDRPPPPKPRRRRRWRLEVNGGSVDVVRRAGRGE